jgi:hypothetical protein
MPVEPTVGYRLILRTYHIAPGSEDDELRNINSSPLPNGALAYCSAVDTLYRLDKSYAGPAVSTTIAFTPIAGGGMWRKIVLGTQYMLFQTNDEAVANPVALPVGDTVALLGTVPFVTVPTDPDTAYQVNATAEIAPGATPGGNVTCFLERQINGGVWTIVDQQNTGVLAATESARVSLIAAGPMGVVGGLAQSLLFRIRCTAATQDCVAQRSHYTALGFMH